MSDRETLKNLIDKASVKLETARDRMDSTPRPASPCSAHDALFALTGAQTDGLLALLAVSSAGFGAPKVAKEEGSSESFGRMDRGSSFIKVVKALTPYRWPAAIACFSQVTPAILDKALLFFK